jgi:hypothetical protein
VWRDLFLDILIYLTHALAITGMNGNVIEPLPLRLEQIAKSFNTEEMKEWKEGVRKGVEENDWEDLIFHRTRRLLSGALILLKHFTARLQSQSSSSDLIDLPQFQHSSLDCE